MTQFELTSKLEFEIQDLKDERIQLLKEKLASHTGIKAVYFVKETNTIFLDTTCSTGSVQSLLEELSNSVVVLKGCGTLTESAVVEITSQCDSIRGVVRLIQLNETNLAVDGTIDGLETHSTVQLSVHENGDLSDSYNNIGKREAILGQIPTDSEGIADFRLVVGSIKLSDLIGRSVVLSTLSNQILACGVVARSARVFENKKRICSCTGKTLWEERESYKTRATH